MQLENNTLYYIYDPMCSWCYAFEPSLSLLQKQCPAKLHFKPILGGLASDSEIPMPIETQAMIKQAWHRIEDSVPNVKFNFDFWIRNTPYRSTYPACRAILAVENQSPDFIGSMRKKIQQAYYQEAKNPSLNDVLIDCARELKLDIDQFSKDLLSLAINEKLTEHIQFSRVLGVRSYPSLCLVLDKKMYSIPIDYKGVATTMSHINQLID